MQSNAVELNQHFILKKCLFLATFIRFDLSNAFLFSEILGNETKYFLDGFETSCSEVILRKSAYGGLQPLN